MTKNPGSKTLAHRFCPNFSTTLHDAAAEVDYLHHRGRTSAPSFYNVFDLLPESLFFILFPLSSPTPQCPASEALGAKTAPWSSLWQSASRQEDPPSGRGGLTAVCDESLGDRLCGMKMVDQAGTSCMGGSWP